MTFYLTQEQLGDIIYTDLFVEQVTMKGMDMAAAKKATKTVKKPELEPEPKIADEAAEPAQRVPAVGDEVVYVLAIGPSAKQARPGVIAARFGETSDVDVTTEPGDELAELYHAQSVPYNEVGAPGTWHWE